MSPVKKTRGTRRPQARGVATRTKLVKAAGWLFVRYGFEGTSRADIANRAGMGMSSIYHHFPDKQDLLLELIDEWSEELAFTQRTAIDLERTMGGDPRGATREFLERTYAEHRKGSSLQRVFAAEADRKPRVRRHYDRAQRQITNWIQELLKIGISRGLVVSERKPAAAAFLVQHVIEMTLIELAARDPSEADEILDELTELICGFIFGLGPREAG